MSYEKYLREIQEKFDDVQSILQDVSLKFNNEILFSDLPNEEELTPKIINQHKRKTEVLFELRDAFNYRQDSILYHFNLLVNTQNNSAQKFNHDLDSRGKKSLLKTSAYQQQFLFDDILFNTISLFDYFGNYGGFIFQGQHGKKLGWNSLYGYCKNEKPTGDSSRQILFNSRVAELIVLNHESWINKLYDYRSQIIHKKIDEIDGSLSYSIPMKGKEIPENDHDIRILVPKNFAKDFKLDKIDEDLSLIKSLYLLMIKSSSSLTSFFKALKKDLNELKQNG